MDHLPADAKPITVRGYNDRPTKLDRLRAFVRDEFGDDTRVEVTTYFDGGQQVIITPMDVALTDPAAEPIDADEWNGGPPRF